MDRTASGRPKHVALKYYIVFGPQEQIRGPGATFLEGGNVWPSVWPSATERIVALKGQENRGPHLLRNCWPSAGVDRG